MYYEINISKNGYHVFATAPRSCGCTRDLDILYKLLSQKFPKSEGYEINITRYETVGYGIDPEDII